MVDKELVSRKLSGLQAYVDELGKSQGVNPGDFDFFTQLVTNWVGGHS